MSVETCHECHGSGCEVCNDLGWHPTLRLTLAEPVKRENPPDIDLALKHHREINAEGRCWAALEIIQFTHERVVRLTIGTIHSNGMKEIPFATRCYFIDQHGAGKYTNSAHV